MTANMPHGDIPETWSDEEIIRRAKKAREDFEKRFEIATKESILSNIKVDPLPTFHDDDLSLKLANLARKMKLENPEIKEPSTRDLLIRALKEFNVDAVPTQTLTPHAEKFISEHGHLHVAPSTWRNQRKAACRSRNETSNTLTDLLAIIEENNASVAFTLATMIDHVDLTNQRIKELKLKLKRKNYE